MAVGAVEMMCDVCVAKSWGPNARQFWVPKDGTDQWAMGRFKERLVSEGGLPRRLVKATQGSDEGTRLEAESRELTLMSGLKRKEPISDPVSSLAPFLGPTPVN